MSPMSLATCAYVCSTGSPPLVLSGLGRANMGRGPGFPSFMRMARSRHLQRRVQSLVSVRGSSFQGEGDDNSGSKHESPESSVFSKAFFPGWACIRTRCIL